VSDACAHQGLADGHVDAALLRLPFPGQDAFHVETLLTEPRWVALPATHRLAHHAEIAFRDLWDEPFIATPPDSGPWRDTGWPPRNATITRCASAR
jgi:DNA-binding transcriptional LysR family regulator